MSTKSNQPQQNPNAALSQPDKPGPQSALPETDLDRHSRKCLICNHPNREDIEIAFLNWDHISTIAKDFQLEPRVIRRHAFATSLAARRTRNARAAVERVLERCSLIISDYRVVLRAAELHASLTTEGRWFEPLRHRRITVVHEYPNGRPAPGYDLPQIESATLRQFPTSPSESLPASPDSRAISHRETTD